ncbi:MAG: hypothetical protein IJ174_10255, partial [Clostridia bacterium]|nr:hypothetical protein [Clostridia bacterium]
LDEFAYHVRKPSNMRIIRPILNGMRHAIKYTLKKSSFQNKISMILFFHPNERFDGSRRGTIEEWRLSHASKKRKRTGKPVRKSV